MKAAIAVISLLSLFSIPVEAQPKLSGSLCVERIEDEGSVNIFPVQLRIDKGPPKTFLGGTKFCASLSEGGHNIELLWPVFSWKRPDHGLHNKAWGSVFALAVVKAGRRTTFSICSNRSEDHVRWLLTDATRIGCSPP